MADGLPDVQGRAITAPGEIRGAGVADAQAASMFDKVAGAAQQIGQVVDARAVKQAKKDALKDFNDRDQFAEDIGADNLGKFNKRSGALGLQTAGDHAYNNMVEALYLQRSKTDISAKAAELRADPKNFGNVEEFDEGMSAFRDGMAEDVDPNFAEQVFYELDSVQQTVRGQVAGDRQAAVITEAKQAMDTNLSEAEDGIDAILRERGPSALLDDDVVKMMGELADQRAIKVGNPLYAYSQEQADAEDGAFRTKLAVSSALPTIETHFKDKGYAATLQFADDTAAARKGSAKDRETLRSALRQEVNLLQQNRNALLAEQEAAEKARKQQLEDLGDEYDKRASDVRYRPGATTDEKVAAVLATRPYVAPARYGTLMAAVYDETTNKGVGDTEFTQYRIMAMRNELDVDQVMELSQFTSTQRDQLLDEIEKTGDNVRKTGIDRIKASYKQGTKFINNQTAQQLATREVQTIDQFDRWLEGLDHTPNPREVSDQINAILSSGGMSTVLVESSSYLLPSPRGFPPKPEELAAARERIKQDYRATLRALGPDMRETATGGADPSTEEARLKLAEEMLLLDEIERSLDNAR